MRTERIRVLARVIAIAAVAGAMVAARAATLGNVVAIGGEAADIALDEARGVLYIANFTASRIDVLSLSDQTVHSSIHVAAAPSALALSPNGQYLVVTHFGNVTPPGSPANAVSILDRTSGSLQTLALSDPPLGVAFGADGMAFLATTTRFLRLDPASGETSFINSIANVTANSIPAAPGTPPVQIVAAAMASSGNGQYIFGLTDSIYFRYDVALGQVTVTGYTSTPTMGPRVVSVASDGSYYAAGWGLFGRTGVMLGQFPNAAGLLAVGSYAIDSVGGFIYGQIPTANAAAGASPVLTIWDADNLTVEDNLQLSENLTGRSVLNRAANTMYAVSESGVTVLPVGSFQNVHRLAADHEDLVFAASFCQPGAITQSMQIVDPAGGTTAFSLSTTMAGVVGQPSSGQTPATIQVTVDPTVFQDRQGTVAGLLTISSAQAVNLPPAVRLLVNNQRPDERGAWTDVPGTLVDVLADPARDRFYLLRQDRNQVLVYDGSGLSLLATLRTGTTPTRMALTMDSQYLLVGHDNSQLAYVFDLDSLMPSLPIVFPAGHYPRSIAASGSAILAAARVVGPANTIDRIDFPSRTAVALPSLGVFQNSVNADTVLAGSANGASILSVSADGNLFLYDAGANSFTVSRQIASALAGDYAASGAGQFAAGNYLLNASLVPTATWSGSAFSSGFAFLNGQGLLLTGPQSASGASGVVARMALPGGSLISPTGIAEQPMASAGNSVFTRTLAPLANGNAIIALTISGFTALSWNFAAAVVAPSISSIVNAASLDSAVAPGSLISVFGNNLSPTSIATSQMPLPTAIGQSCLTANGLAIPMMFVSPQQINAQLPLYLAGSVTMTLYTPGGSSDDYFLSLQPVAPAVFESGTAGPLTGIATVVKASNQQLVTPSNPIHGNDWIVIYATGLGATSPAVAAGLPAPYAPPALAVVAPDVSLGGVPLAVSYAGLAPGEAGVYQINAQVPPRPPVGDQVPLTITQGGVTSSVVERVVN
jgi:uncharacterized protein (TIGR03437 family)